MKHRVLVIDDDRALLANVRKHLEREGFDVETEADGAAALKAAQGSDPDLVVLDVTLPGAVGDNREPLDGIEILRRLRDQNDVPVLMLSATNVGAVKVMALTLGADDYLTKPFDMQELTARIHAILRRSQKTGAEGKALDFGRLRIDPESRRVWKDGNPVDLTAIEFELLYTLARRPGRVFTRDNLIEQAWKFSYYGVAKVVDVHIGHIRRKVEDDPAQPAFIVTVRGTGYRFEPPAPPPES